MCEVIIFKIDTLVIRKAVKKVLPLVARPLRGGVKGWTIKERTFFEILKKEKKSNGHLARGGG